MKKLFHLSTLTIMLCVSCNHQEKGPCSNAQHKTDIEVFKTDKGWGYVIYLNKKKYIRQEHIPAINGLKAFKTKSDAEKIARLMQVKICNDILPPSLTKEEIFNEINVD